MRPIPKTWIHDARDTDLIIPKSMAIQYAQIPFYLYNLEDTQVMVDMITQVRKVCAKFEERGLPNFPSGHPFTYWEAYLDLNLRLLAALACILAAIFVMTSILMINIKIGAIVLVVLLCYIIQLHGFMGFFGFKLSAIPAVISVVAVGFCTEIILHIVVVSFFKIIYRRANPNPGS